MTHAPVRASIPRECLIRSTLSLPLLPSEAKPTLPTESPHLESCALTWVVHLFPEVGDRPECVPPRRDTWVRKDWKPHLEEQGRVLGWGSLGWGRGRSQHWVPEVVLDLPGHDREAHLTSARLGTEPQQMGWSASLGGGLLRECGQPEPGGRVEGQGITRRLYR